MVINRTQIPNVSGESSFQALAALAPREGPAKPRREQASAPLVNISFAKAVDQWNKDHPASWPNSGGSCPACDHHECFGHLDGDPFRWVCFSENHGPDAEGCGVEGDACWHGDALNLEAHRRKVSPHEVLRSDGYLNGIASSTRDHIPEKRPLNRKIPPPEDYPIDALGDVLGPMVTRMMEVIQAPDAICAQSVLAAAALGVQGFSTIHIDSRRIPLNAFFLTVGESGERKSASDDLALGPHRKYQHELYEAYQCDFTDYQTELAAYNAAHTKALKNANQKVASVFEGRAQLDEIGDAPKAPFIPMLLCQEPTYEGLIKQLLVGRPSMGLFSDEGGRFIGGHGMSAEHMLKTTSSLSNLWDAKPISRLRAGDGSATIYGRRVSMHLMAQPGVMQKLLGDPLLLEQGFLSRCLTAWPTSTQGQRAYCDADLGTDASVVCYQDRMGSILRAPLPLKLDPKGQPLNELEPLPLFVDRSAKQIWVRFHDHIEVQLGDDKDLAHIRGFASKAAEHALRLAGILCRVECLEGNISAPIMDAAITLTEFYLAEALRLFATAAIDPDLVAAQKLLGWAKLQVGPIHLAQIYQRGPHQFREAKFARQIMTILEEHGWVVRVEGGAKIDGSHRKDVWRLVA